MTEEKKSLKEILLVILFAIGLLIVYCVEEILCIWIKINSRLAVFFKRGIDEKRKKKG